MQKYFANIKNDSPALYNTMIKWKCRIRVCM